MKQTYIMHEESCCYNSPSVSESWVFLEFVSNVAAAAAALPGTEYKQCDRDPVISID